MCRDLGELCAQAFDARAFMAREDVGDAGYPSGSSGCGVFPGLCTCLKSISNSLNYTMISWIRLNHLDILDKIRSRYGAPWILSYFR